VSSFSGLSTALSGLRVHQYAMDVVANNIANAATPGYHRQEAVIVPGLVLTGAFGIAGTGIPQLGTGATVDTVRRMRSSYIDDQVRAAGNWLGEWNYRNEALKQVESVLSEPGDLGLSSMLDKFWNSWEELSASPESLTARTNVVETGVSLAQRFRSMYSDLREMQAGTDRDIVDNAEQVNRLAHEIAKINEEIRPGPAGDYQPNDLLDRRDVLIDELSRIARVQVSGAGGTDLIVSIGGKVLVQGNQVTEIVVSNGPNGWSQLTWADNGSSVVLSGGELAGQLDTRDYALQGYIDSLNTVASALVDRVNALHSTGQLADGSPAGSFFVPGTDASNIKVEASLVSSPSGVATSTTGKPGDNALALAISAVRDEILIGGETIGGAYSGLVARIGANARQAESRVDTHTASLAQLDNQRESVSGVSLDEEMANMVRFQQAYNASARVFTVIDEMIDTVVSRMGISGR